MHRKTKPEEIGFGGIGITASKNLAVAIAIASLFALGDRANNAYWSTLWFRHAATEGIDFEYKGVWGNFIGSITLSIGIACAAGLAWHLDKPFGRAVMSFLIWLPWFLASLLAIGQGYYLLRNY